MQRFKEYGEAFASIMEEQGFSQRRLSRESGVSAQTIRSLQRGETAGQLGTWRKIGSAMGIPSLFNAVLVRSAQIQEQRRSVKSREEQIGVHPDPTPVHPDPTPVHPDPTPVHPDPTPVHPDPTPGR